MTRKTLLYYLTTGFVLNFIWEVSQSGLYEPHFQGLSDFLFVHLKASLGDVAMLLIIYLVIALIYKNASKGKAELYAISALLGFIVAVFVEKYALLTGRWAYNDLMPIIPYIKVGLTPILQMTIIVPLSLFLAIRINNRRGM